jgi:hypothetical protein
LAISTNILHSLSKTIHPLDVSSTSSLLSIPNHNININMGIYTISTGLLLLASSATALRQTRPVERSTGRFCSWPVVNTITSQIAVWKDPELVAGVFVGPSSTTGSITAGYAFTKSESITGSISATYSMSVPNPALLFPL